MRTKHTHPVQTSKKTGSVHTKRIRTGNGGHASNGGNSVNGASRRSGSTHPGRKIQSATTQSLHKQVPQNTRQGKLPRNRDIQLVPNKVPTLVPNQKSQQVDAEPAFLPLLLLWGLFGRKKKNNAGQSGGTGARPGGWGGMGTWGGNGTGAGGWSGMGSTSPWFQSPGAGAGEMGQMPAGPMANQGMGGWSAPMMPWGAGGTPGLRGPVGGYPQAPSSPGYPGYPGYPAGIGNGSRFSTWF